MSQAIECQRCYARRPGVARHPGSSLLLCRSCREKILTSKKRKREMERRRAKAIAASTASGQKANLKIPPKPESEASFDTPAVSHFGDRSVDRMRLEEEARILKRAVDEEERELGRSSYWHFLTQILFKDVWEQHYTDLHRDLARDIQEMRRGDSVWVFFPRKRRKSYVGTIGHVPWRIINDPNIRYLLVGAREETVKPFARLIRSIFIPNSNPMWARFQELYPEFLLPPSGMSLRQAFQFSVPNRTAALADPTFRATYLGVTGAGWRCDVLDFDDAVERRNVTTPEMSAKTFTQMMDLFPLLDDTGNYEMVLGKGTRWAYHDPYGHIIGEREEGAVDQDLLEAFRKKRVQVYVRHALEKPDTTCQRCPPHVVAAHPHGEPSMDGVSIDHPIHTIEDVHKEFERYKVNPNLGESLAWHQLMNVCVAPSEQRFQEDWFLRYDRDEWPVSRLHALVVDSASKDLQTPGRGDWMVSHWGSFDDNGRLLVRHSIRNNRWTKDEFIRQIVAACQRMNWWPHVIGKEKFGEDSFLIDIGRVFQGFGHPVRLKVIKRMQGLSKNDFIVDSLQGPFERAEVVFAKSYPVEMLDRGKYELCNLGQVTHEDWADALAGFMADGVRVVKPDYRGMRPRTPWRTPDLSPYTDKPAPPTDAGAPYDPYEDARQRKRVTTAFATLVGDPRTQVQWDPPVLENPVFGGIDDFDVGT